MRGQEGERYMEIGYISDRIEFGQDFKQNDENSICCQWAECIGDDEILVSQYRKRNSNFPKSFIINSKKEIIWSTEELEKVYDIQSSTSTYDNNILVYVKGQDFDLLEVDSQNQEIARFNVKKYGASKLYHYYKTKKNTILCSAPNEHKIMELNYDGDMIFEFCPGKDVLYEPRCVFLTKDDLYLVSDSKNHYVIMVDRKGNIVWSYGEKNNPGFHGERMMYPYMARELENGNILIAEHQANRVTEITKQKKQVWYYGNRPDDEVKSPRINYLNGPNYAQKLQNGDVLISDSMNGRIVSISADYVCKDFYGMIPKNKFILNFPRSIQVLKNGHFLIADSRNNRIVELDKEGKVYLEYGNSTLPVRQTLKWPRCVWLDEETQEYYISDGFNQRFLILDRYRSIKNEISFIYYHDEKIPLYDPHSVVKAENGDLLIFKVMPRFRRRFELGIRFRFHLAGNFEDMIIRIIPM